MVLLLAEGRKKYGNETERKKQRSEEEHVQEEEADEVAGEV